ncbi:MAG: hypothetical protein WCJ30_14160, partial [Deltaproteobacteria bacterium]
LDALAKRLDVAARAGVAISQADSRQMLQIPDPAEGAPLTVLGPTVDSGVRAGPAAQSSRALLMLDPRSALGVAADEEVREVEDGAVGTRVRCGELTDTPFFVSPGGLQRATPGAMYACRTVMDAPTFVLGLATAPGDVDAPPRAVRVIARRDAITARPWDRDRFAEAQWAIAVPPAPATSSDRIDVFRAALGPDAIEAVSAQGAGYAVAISLQHALYVGWLSPQLAAEGPLHRVDAGGVAAHGAALAWNGREALVVFVGGDGAAARLYGARVTLRGGASRAVLLAAPAGEGATMMSPSASAFGSGEWITAWVEAVAGGGGQIQRGVVRAMPMRADLTARESPHAYGGVNAARVAIAARAERFVLTLLGGERREATVSIASGRCPSGPYVPPPAAAPAGDEVPTWVSPAALEAAGAMDSGVPCVARPHAAFRLAPGPLRPPAGNEIDAGQVAVVERGTTQRGVRTAFRVRTDQGATGWIFLGPDELGSACGIPATP